MVDRGDFEQIKFRPQSYNVNIELPDGTIGAHDSASIALNDRIFILRKITHQIIAVEEWPDPPSLALTQDGLYTINWSVFNQLRFFKGAVPLAPAAFGSAATGIWLPLEAPVVLPAQETIEVEVTNMITREHPITVQIMFHGIERVDRPDTTIVSTNG